ncbi:MAG: GNAT family N-acetyltransferase [Anaerolineae bacterium]
MPQLTIYRFNEALPPELECQIRAFIRLTWYDAYAENPDLEAPMLPPDDHPQHVVLAERHALISHARLSWVQVDHAGERFKTYCLGDVFTYPAFRGKGYGRIVADAATALIREDGDADIAILFCDPKLEEFYGQCGWSHVPDLTANIGEIDALEPHNHFAMMLLLSDKARRSQDAFRTQTIFLPGYDW